jgi:hypothetical protein
MEYVADWDGSSAGFSRILGEFGDGVGCTERTTKDGRMLGIFGGGWNLDGMKNGQEGKGGRKPGRCLNGGGEGMVCTDGPKGRMTKKAILFVL